MFMVLRCINLASLKKIKKNHKTRGENFNFVIIDKLLLNANIYY